MARTIYVYLWMDREKGVLKDKPFACSNKRILANRSGIGYDNLMRIFTRQGRRYYGDGEHIIIKIYEDDIIRGRQKIKKRGRRFGEDAESNVGANDY